MNSIFYDVIDKNTNHEYFHKYLFCNLILCTFIFIAQQIIIVVD